MNRTLQIFLLGSALTGSACATTSGAADPATDPHQLARPAWPGPTRSEAECGAVVARATMAPRDSVSPPRFTRLRVPPVVGVPRGQEGLRVRVELFVSERGLVIADSTRITPAIRTGRYDQDFRETMAQTVFHPALLEGCAVPSWASIDVTLPLSGL